MRKDLVEIVCCPVHKTALKLHVAKEDERGDVLTGHLTCGKCRFDYPIEEGIPNLLPPEYHRDEVKESGAPVASGAGAGKARPSKRPQAAAPRRARKAGKAAATRKRAKGAAPRKRVQAKPARASKARPSRAGRR